jgi:hypothetical protein
LNVATASSRDITRRETGRSGLDDLAHLRLELLEVLRREGAAERKVVVEAVLDDRADRDLGVGIDRLHRLRQQVCRRMTQDLEPVGILSRDDADGRVAVDDVARVDELAVHPAGKRGPGESGPMSAATWATVTACANCLWLPSGSVIAGIGESTAGGSEKGRDYG